MASHNNNILYKLIWCKFKIKERKNTLRTKYKIDEYKLTCQYLIIKDKLIADK